jgi:hypothetical protein
MAIHELLMFAAQSEYIKSISIDGKTVKISKRNALLFLLKVFASIFPENRKNPGTLE